jgi:hypothetical protein
VATIINKDFGNIYVGGSTDFSLRIYRADNVLSVFLNGSEVYSRSTGGDPRLNDRVKLALKNGDNNLSIVGWNSNARGHYHWELYYGAGRMDNFVANDSPTKRFSVSAVYTMRFVVQSLLNRPARKKSAKAKRSKRASV